MVAQFKALFFLVALSPGNVILMLIYPLLGDPTFEQVSPAYGLLGRR